MWHRKSLESSFQWTRRNIHIDTECRDHRLVRLSVTVTIHLVFIRSLYDMEDRCLPLFFDLVNVGKEVSKWLPIVLLVEWRRHNKWPIFVGREALLNLKKKESLLPIISTENVLQPKSEHIGPSADAFYWAWEWGQTVQHRSSTFWWMAWWT